MAVTFILLAAIIFGVFLMLWAAVAFMQDKKYFTSAPKDMQEAIQPHEERLNGAHAVGWILMAAAAVLMIGSVIIAIADGGCTGNFPSHNFFCDICSRSYSSRSLKERIYDDEQQ